MIDEVPSQFANIVALTPLHGGLRLTFSEQTSNDTVPVPRSAIYVPAETAKALLDLLAQVLAPKQEAPAKAARKARK